MAHSARPIRPLHPVWAVALAVCAWVSCGAPASDPHVPAGTDLVDPAANTGTVNLYLNLRNLAGTGLMFGHQNTLAYGYSWVSEELAEGESRSDVKDVTGSFPAVYGWDVADFMNPRFSDSLRLARMDRLLDWSREGFGRGGVLTYSWHTANPVTGGSFYDTTRAVHAIVPGGDQHEAYKTSLDHLAEFFLALDTIPAIFRPWHEHNGDWFWWGKGLATEEDYVALWRFTVEYLRDVKGVHNLLYAFSPDRSRMDIETFKTDYFYGYPGDDYVDIIGLDNYWDLGHPANETPPELRREHFRRSLEQTVEIAQDLGKVAALTETGLEAVPDSTWWTDTILSTVKSNATTRQITYFLVWRNANRARENRDHYYAPFPGQASAADFVRFKEDSFVLFEDELPPMYQRPNPVQR